VALHYRGADVRGKGNSVRRAASGARREDEEVPTAKRRAVFFPGCAIGYFQQDMEDASLAVLEALGYDVVRPRDIRCCGRPFLSLGDREAAQACAERNAQLLQALDADVIVTACASCGLTFKQEYRSLLASSGAGMPPVKDMHEILAGGMDRLRLGSLPGRYTVHDPCHLGRGQGLSGTLRAVLRAVPGVDLVEMREPDRCCGFGGMMRATHPDLSRAMGNAKARDIAATGAPLVVTGCPSCRMQISDALRRRGTDAEVVHTVQVIAEAMRNAECGIRNEGKQQSSILKGERGRQ
jgi:glycolate oxidase iron-sulfur subunit